MTEMKTHLKKMIRGQNMGLENELLTFKELLKAEKEKLAKAEAIEIVEDDSNPFTVEERIEAQNRLIKSTTDEIKEIQEIITEIIEEMTDEEMREYNKGVKEIKSPEELEDFLIISQFEIECEDYESSEQDADYMAFTLKWDEDIVYLDEDIHWENPFTCEEFLVKDILHENAYIVEVPKKTEMNEIMDEYCNSFKEAYKKTLVRELGVYGIAHSIIHERLLTSDNPVQAMNEGELDALASNWEQALEDMDVSDLYFMSSEDVEKLIKEEYYEKEY